MENNNYGGLRTSLLEMNKALQSISILENTMKQLAWDNSIASISIKNAIVEKVAYQTVIKTMKDQIQDGWQALTPQLNNEILNF